MVMALSAVAQTPMATLSHDGQLTFFDGEYALEQAVEAATDGDIIYLSEGDFDANIENGWHLEEYRPDGGIGYYNGLFIGKRITIQGSGYKSNILCGLIYGHEIADNNSDEKLNLSNLTLLDGVSVRSVEFNPRRGNHTPSFSTENTIISNCYIHDLDLTSYIEGLLIDRCKIDFYCGAAHDIEHNYNYLKNSKISEYDASEAWYHDTDIIENCHIKSLREIPYKIYNSVVNFNFEEIRRWLYIEIINSLIGDKESNYEEWGSSNSYITNCCWVIQSDVLNDNLECTEDLSHYIGTDGTQIGLYGGEGRPYSEYPSVPTVDTANSSVKFDKKKNQINVTISVAPK